MSNEEALQKLRIAGAVETILEAVGEDIGRSGLQDTPMRVAKAMYNEWFSGYRADIDAIFTKFPHEGYDEIVVVKNIPFYSMCEHHMAPFFGKAHVGYLPDEHIIGLSKVARLVDAYAKRLQVQERLTMDVGSTLHTKLRAKGVGVIMTAEHMCMCSRGVEKPGSKTITSAMFGYFLDKPPVRDEFMRLVRFD